MGARYKSEFYSHDGILWTIQIMDSLYSSTETLFKTTNEGFKLSYKGLQDRFDPILASEVTIPCLAENAAFETLLNDIMQGQEERFGVVIKKSGLHFWAGVLLQDLVQMEDIAYPYVVELKFSDGLGRLKDIDYNNNGTAYTGRSTFLTHLINILSKTGIISYWTTSPAMVFLKTCVNWYDANHVYTRPDWCPTAYSDLDHSTFIKMDDDGNYIYKNCNDVLDQICRTWNARILLSDGAFHFMQVGEYANNFMRTRSFLKSGSLYYYTLNDNFRILTADYKRMAGGLHKYYPPLRSVKKTYEYFQSINNNNLLPNQEDFETAINLLNSVPGGSGEKLVFSGMVHHWLTGTTVTQFSVRFKLKIVFTPDTGTVKYLTNQNAYGNYEWSTDSSKYCQYDTPIIQGAYWDMNYPISFTTPQISVSGSATFQFLDVGFYFGANTVNLPAGSVWDYECLNFSLTMNYGDTQTSEGKVEFIAVNTKTNGTPVDSTSKIELPNTFIGDGPYTFSVGRIKTYNGTTWVNSTSWYIHTIRPGKKINQLAVDQVLFGQKIPTAKYNGAFCSHHITAVKVVIWGAKVLLPLSFNLSPTDDIVSGEWFSCIVGAGNSSKAGFWIDEGNWIDDDTWEDTVLQGLSDLDEITKLPRNIPSIYEFINKSIATVETKNSNLINLNIITTTDQDIAAGATTSIPIAAYTDTTLVHDDIIQLIDPVTFEIHNLTVALNPGSINSIAIDSYTFAKDIPSGAYIVFSNKEILKIVR